MIRRLGFIISLAGSILGAKSSIAYCISAFVSEPDARIWEACPRDCGCSPVPFTCPWGGRWCLRCYNMWNGKNNLFRPNKQLEVASLFQTLLMRLFFQMAVALDPVNVLYWGGMAGDKRKHC